MGGATDAKDADGTGGRIREILGRETSLRAQNHFRTPRNMQFKSELAGYVFACGRTCYKPLRLSHRTVRTVTTHLATLTLSSLLSSPHAHVLYIYGAAGRSDRLFTNENLFRQLTVL